MSKALERFHFIDTIFDTSRLGLIRLSVCNSVFNATEDNNRFIYALDETVL